MDDQELAKYITKHGDRMAVRQYCEKYCLASESDLSLPVVAKKLKDKIEKKRCGFPSEGSRQKSVKLSGNQNATKEERRFELGWKHHDGKEYRQVRERNGGGTRHMKANKFVTMKAVLEMAKDLFFPGGSSKKGAIDEFEIVLQDLTGEEVPYSRTVSEQYELRRMKMIRLYLCTKGKIIPDHTEDLLSNMNTGKKSDDQLKFSNVNTQETSNNNTSCSIGNPQVADLLSDINVGISKKVDIISCNMNNPQESGLKSNMSNVITPHKSNEDAENVRVSCIISNPQESDLKNNMMASGLPLQKSNEDAENVLLDYAIAQSLSMSEDNEIRFKTFLNDSLDSDEDKDVLPDLPPLTSSPKSFLKKLKLHRGHVFSDLNEAVKTGLLDVTDRNVEVLMILPNGATEQGEDTGGVLRDALSEYWDTFYKKCTIGNSVRVPVIRHDMKDTWTDIAKIIVIGMQTVGYFPIRIAQPFLDRCLGKNTPEPNLIESFLEFIPDHEKKIIQSNELDFSDEDFLDLLEAHDIKTIVSGKNWQKVLSEIAHKELIQEPAYITECWTPILQKYLSLKTDEIKDVITALQPSAKKVIACLSFEKDLKPKEVACAEYLKKFIRHSSKDRLQRLLRFCTGADTLVCTAIHVRFTEPANEFARNPVGHTCGCVLEVPSTYSSFQELSEEFNELLLSNVWVMDLI